jgi:hypothetical protein
MERAGTGDGFGNGAPGVRGLPGCLKCGPVELQPVFDGEITNFYCDLCGSCWHFESGYVVPVHPETCPGCQLEEVCRERVHA